MYKNILLSVDLNGEASWSAPLETALAMCRNSDAKLHVVHVIADVPEAVVTLYLPNGSTAKLIERFTEMLNAFIDEHIPKELGAVAHLRKGSVYMGILETAKAVNADLIVIGSHRPTMGNFLLGPNAARVVRHAESSVFVVRS